MAKKIAGICYIKVDGQQLSIEGGVEVNASSVQRETKMGLSGPAGYSEIARVPRVAFTGFVPADFPFAMLEERTDLTITVSMANGKNFTLSDAYQVGEPNFSPVDGTVNLEFNGMQGFFNE